MSARRGPTRLSELAAETPVLAAAIRGVRAEHADSARLAALAERLAPQLAGSAPPLASAGSTLAPWIKGVLGLSLVLALAGVAYFAARERAAGAGSTSEPRAIAPARTAVSATQREQHDERREPARPGQAQTAVPAAAASVAEAVAVGGVETRPYEAQGSERRAKRASPEQPAARGERLRARVPSESAPARTAADELALLERARAALDGDAALVLALAAQHARDFPRGVFRQEREVLAIEALLKLKRRREARERAAAFMQRYPQSPHARRVRGLLELVPAAQPAP